VSSIDRGGGYRTKRTTKKAYGKEKDPPNCRSVSYCRNTNTRGGEKKKTAGEADGKGEDWMSGGIGDLSDRERRSRTERKKGCDPEKRTGDQPEIEIQKPPGRNNRKTGGRIRKEGALLKESLEKKSATAPQRLREIEEPKGRGRLGGGALNEEGEG